MRKNVATMLDSATGAVCEALYATEVGARIVRKELEAYEQSRDLELGIERTELELELAQRQHDLDVKRQELKDKGILKDDTK